MALEQCAIKITDVSLYFIPVKMRMPLKFGNQVMDSVTCARAKVTVQGADGKTAVGWGETAIAVGWAWPAPIDFEVRHTAMKDFPILEANRIDVHSVSARQPLFMDESAHDWHFVRLGRELGWTGVALKTCKTQAGALLSLCWAKAHGMTLMVQDLINPMLAQIPHVQLAAHTGTIMGAECNGMQFYPDASLPDAEVHLGLYQRKNGALDLSSLSGSRFGCRVDEVKRELPEAII